MTDVLAVLARSIVRDTDITGFTVAPSMPQPIAVKIALTPVFRAKGRTHAGGLATSLVATRREYQVEAAEPESHPCTAALRDLQAWLGMPLDALVSLVGLSPSVRQFWREHPNAPVRPDKAGRVLRLHTAVGLLVGALGPDNARVALREEGWLDEPLDGNRLGELEGRVRNALRPAPLRMPAHLDAGLTPKLLAQVVEPRDDLAQQRRERERLTDSFGPEEHA